MAGHSQFKNIMYRKGAQDAKRAKLFAKIAREITVAAKSGLPDPKQNPRLRNAIINARHENMPNDKIKKAIQKASSAEDNNSYEEIRYEGIGNNGISLIIETLTDNRNRTASEIRSILNKNGGSLGELGSVSFNFEKVGEITFSSNNINFNDFFDYSVNIGALDILEEEDHIIITTEPEYFGNIRDQLEKKYVEPKTSKLIWKAKNSISTDTAIAKNILKIIDLLEDNDDVQNVYSNAIISENIEIND